MIQELWTPWIIASTTKHFATKASAKSVDFFAEGQERTTGDRTAWIEFRLDGPEYRELTRDTFRIDVEINIGISVVQNPDDFYKPHQLAGIVASFFTIIPVYRYGDPMVNPLNDGVHIGCLELDPDRREKIVTSYFGKVKPDTRVVQMSVEGHYRMFLS